MVIIAHLSYVEQQFNFKNVPKVNLLQFDGVNSVFPACVPTKLNRTIGAFVTFSVTGTVKSLDMHIL